jgi:hypothetical protein
MFDIKINKVFVDTRTGLDMYVLSIQMGDVYYNLNVTKEQFEKIAIRLKSIYDNNELN